ncbi:MAG TPA: glutaredoxin family protein [Mycobacteriales bacterium]|jgi:glutaredoxin|nr:glutaredoxin family protein [Mycobacteriales bacterium]
MPPADHQITLLTRAGCHLCDDARAVLHRVAAEVGTPVREQDVDADAQLRARYGDWVPVIQIDGRDHGFYRVEEERLRAALAR